MDDVLVSVLVVVAVLVSVLSIVAVVFVELRRLREEYRDR